MSLAHVPFSDFSFYSIEKLLQKLQGILFNKLIGILDDNEDQGITAVFEYINDNTGGVFFIKF